LKQRVLQHAYDRVMGNLPGESSCADVAALASRHPDASFICAHTGNDWERGIRMIRATTNVYAEVCGSDPTAGFVEMAVRELGPDRVIYGSDAGGRSFASQLAKVLSAELPDAARRLILGENLRRLLAPRLAVVQKR
ncbi:MAG: amidohydrolase family protein, partial [Thermoguttaceae bacterium]|nr:amidohydrolase family protein [Thermoguttaceae bacterium]